MMKEVLEHRFFRKSEVPTDLFPCDSRAILDWVEGAESVIVKSGNRMERTGF